MIKSILAYFFAFAICVPSTAQIRELDAVAPSQNTSLSEKERVEAIKSLERLAAEVTNAINRTGVDQKRKILKTFISSATTGSEYAAYYRKAAEEIEKVGTVNFPEIDGKKQFGRVIMSIPVTEQGTLYMADGGPRIERSSGNLWLDQYVLQIICKAITFPIFHLSGMPTGFKEVRVLIAEFNFV